MTFVRRRPRSPVIWSAHRITPRVCNVSPRSSSYADVIGTSRRGPKWLECIVRALRGHDVDRRHGLCPFWRLKVLDHLAHRPHFATPATWILMARGQAPVHPRVGAQEAAS